MRVKKMVRPYMKKISIIILFAIVLFSCDALKKTDSTDSSDNSDDITQENEFILVDEIEESDYRMDEFVVNSISIENDTLNLNVSYSGGCKHHVFTLFASNYFMESIPVQSAMLLSHNANDDVCEAYASEDISFVLTPLKELYISNYGDGSVTIIINLKTTSSEGQQLEYAF
jgi:hypothetical protein